MLRSSSTRAMVIDMALPARVPALSKAAESRNGAWCRISSGGLDLQAAAFGADHLHPCADFGVVAARLPDGVADRDAPAAVFDRADHDDRLTDQPRGAVV